MAESLSDRELLHEGATALERLLAGPDLHLDSLEQTTREAIIHAHSVLKQIRVWRQQVYCVLCGELMPEVSFTEADRGQLVAFAHRACADKARKSAIFPEQS